MGPRFSTASGVRIWGARFFIARWARGCKGIIPQGLSYASGGNAAAAVVCYLAEGQRVGQNELQCNTRCALKSHARCPIVGPSWSHHSKTNQCHCISHCHRSPVKYDQPNGPLVPRVNTRPLAPKYCNFRRPYLCHSLMESGVYKRVGTRKS